LLGSKKLGGTSKKRGLSTPRKKGCNKREGFKAKEPKSKERTTVQFLPCPGAVKKDKGK